MGGLFFLLVVHLTPFVFLKRTRLGMSPVKIVTLISGIVTIPYFILIMINPEISDFYKFVFNEKAFQSRLFEFSIYYCLSLVTIFVGIAMGSKLYFKEARQKTWVTHNARSVRRFALLLIVLSVFLIAYKFRLAGGIGFFLANIQFRASLLAGTGHIDILLVPATAFSAFLLIYSHYLSGKPRVWVIVLTVMFIASLLMLFGGRKAPISLVLTSILAATVFFPRLSLFSFRFTAVYVFTISIFLVLSWVRVDAHSAYNSAPGSSFEILKQTSYIDNYLFILDYFSKNDFWYGATFPEMILRFLPGYYPAGAPPLDDGVYVRTLWEARRAEPGMAFADLYQSSYPPETFGFGYMNFGFTGVAGFSLIKGLILGLVFNFTKSRDYEPYSLYFLIYMSMNFHLTNLRIFQALIVLVGIIIIAKSAWISRVRISKR